VVEGLHHVAVRVADVENGVKFYTDVLGFREEMRLTFEDGSYLVQVRAGGSIVELFGGGRPGGEDRGEVGYTHIALKVDSLDTEYERLTELGYEFHVEPQDVQGIRCAFFRDPDGNPIELIE
jgi:catechol 2,3-dioxygenase-like lactoylglutathione lyase family enzyme